MTMTVATPKERHQTYSRELAEYTLRQWSTARRAQMARENRQGAARSSIDAAPQSHTEAPSSDRRGRRSPPKGAIFSPEVASNINTDQSIRPQIP